MEKEHFLTLLISACAEIARLEGITDEEKLAIRANEILEDAAKDVPTSVAGTAARTKALENSDAPVVAERAAFDMNPLWDTTVTPSVKEIFEKIAEYAGPLAMTASNPSKELITEREKAMNDLSIDTFKILNKNKVILLHLEYLFKDMKDIVDMLDKTIRMQVEGHSKEILSRAIGVRHPNPKDHTFKSEFSTYQDLLDARQKIIDATGGKSEDYFRKFETEVD